MKKNKGLYDMTLSAVLAALLSVSSMIYIPTAIPITVQTLVWFFGFFCLGGRRTVAGALLYVMIGALGVPVFSGFSGGIGRLFDATGGYIFGLILGALLFWLLEANFGNGKHRRILYSLAALILLYISGTLWYALVYLGGEGSVGGIILVCLLPFILPDLLKMALAYVICGRISRYIAKKRA